MFDSYIYSCTYLSFLFYSPVMKEPRREVSFTIRKSVRSILKHEIRNMYCFD